MDNHGIVDERHFLTSIYNLQCQSDGKEINNSGNYAN